MNPDDQPPENWDEPTQDPQPDYGPAIQKSEWVCLDCWTIDAPRWRHSGTRALTAALLVPGVVVFLAAVFDGHETFAALPAYLFHQKWILLLIAVAAIHERWIWNTRHCRCRHCNSASVVPDDSPRAKQMIG